MLGQRAPTVLVMAAPEVTPAKSHPLAYRVMRLLTHRDEADLRFVFAALASRVHPENDGRRESALVALERCATDLGVPEPTTRGYANWRESSDAHRGAPSVQQIRTAFNGSWTRAVHAMPQVPGTDPLVRRLTARGPKFTKTECVDALKRWHAETGDNITGSYKIWARRARQADPHARVPVCCDAAREWFGSWVGALDAAGIELTYGGARRGRPQRVRNVTRDEVVASVRLAYEALGEPFTQPRYDDWVRRKAADHGGNPTPFRLCSGAVVCAMHQGRWSNAVTVILEDNHEATTAVQRRAKRFTDDELTHAWLACRTTLNGRPSIDEYTQWRASVAEETGFETWPPSICAIAQRFGGGSWIAACEHILQNEEPPDG